MLHVQGEKSRVLQKDEVGLKIWLHASLGGRGLL